VDSDTNSANKAKHHQLLLRINSISVRQCTMKVVVFRQASIVPTQFTQLLPNNINFVNIAGKQEEALPHNDAYIVKISAQCQHRPKPQETLLETHALLICNNLFVSAFCNEVVAICCKNVLYSLKKKFPYIPQGMKKQSSLINLSKVWKIICHYVFFRNYALRAKLCDFASTHNSQSPECQFLQNH